MNWFSAPDNRQAEEELGALRAELQEANKFIDQLKKHSSKLETKLEKQKRKHTDEVERIKVEAAATTETREEWHGSEVETVRGVLEKVELTASAQEQRATLSILAAHARLDEALKVSAERLAAKREVEKELEGVRRQLLEMKMASERRERELEREDGLHQHFTIVKAELDMTKQELSETKARAIEAKREASDAASALQEERDARRRFERELQVARTELERERSMANKQVVSHAASPHIASAIAQQRKQDAQRRVQAAADLDDEMEAAERRALGLS